MKKTCTLILAFLLSAFAVPAMAADWSYDFDNFSDVFGDNYANSTLDLTLNNLTWHVHGVMPSVAGDAGDDWSNSGRSLRLYGESKKDRQLGPEMTNFTLTTPRDIGKVSFYIHEHGRWPASYDLQVAWILQWSPDGNSWTTVGDSFTASDETKFIERDVNHANAYIRIVRADYATFDYTSVTSNGKITNLDDLTITDINGGSEAPTLSTSESALDFGNMSIGQIGKKSFAVTYSGKEDVDRPTYEITGVDESAFSYESKPTAVEGVDSVTISCRPLRRGTASARFVATYGNLTTTVTMKVVVKKQHEDIAFSGGEGTEDDPYLISCMEDLQELSDSVTGTDRLPQTYEGQYFLMTDDIDMSPLENFAPIGNQLAGAGTENMKSFSGNFDGDGHTIYGLTEKYTDANTVALFGIIENANISNLTLANSNITGSAAVGGLVGLSVGVSTIKNCHVASDVTVTGAYYVAGLCSSTLNDSGHLTISDCTSATTVNGDFSAGIMSTNGQTGTVIERCGNMGPITAQNYPAGGIMGFVSYASTTINNCYNTGAITMNGSDYFGGGIVASAAMLTEGNVITITNCYNAGTLTGQSFYMHPIIPANNLLVDYDDENNYNHDLLTMSNCYFDSDLGSYLELDGTQATSESTMKTNSFTDLLNQGQDYGVWIFVDGKNNGFPVPEGEVPTSINRTNDVVTGNGQTEMYNLSGQRITSAPASGLYIIKKADGSTVKVMRR